MVLSVTTRILRQQLQQHRSKAAATATRAAPLAQRVTPACSMSAAAAMSGIEADKQRVRSEVKAALRQLSTEKMAEESE
jgi:hypothetical protein